jgi:hypothetical protein
VAAVDCRGEEVACIAGSEATVIWPSLIAHADWGTDRRKRQVAVARLSCTGGDSQGYYVVESLAPAAGTGEFFGRLCESADLVRP